MDRLLSQCGAGIDPIAQCESLFQTCHLLILKAVKNVVMVLMGKGLTLKSTNFNIESNLMNTVIVNTFLHKRKYIFNQL